MTTCHRNEKWEGGDKENEKQHGERKQSVSFWEEYFRVVNGAELYSSSSLNLLQCLILRMQSMKPRRQRKQKGRLEKKSFRPKQWDNLHFVLALVSVLDWYNSCCDVATTLKKSLIVNGRKKIERTLGRSKNCKTATFFLSFLVAK